MTGQRAAAAPQDGARTGLANREKWAGFEPLQDERWADLIRSIRDRLVAAAELRAGQRVLDVGAGTGLIALEARHHVGPTGSIVALDISEGALRTCRGHAAADPAAPLVVVAADALRLPFRDQAFDVATARSVLMYFEDKVAVARELRRVLRPGGRVATFDPINGQTVPARWFDAFDPASLPPRDAAIFRQLAEELRARRLRADLDRPVVLGFDERDLVRAFCEAGFARVQLTYEYGWTEAQRPRPTPVEELLVHAYGELARERLGAAAEEHLAWFAGLRVTLPPRGALARAYVVATT
ncbi:MAG TPA: methyltransferase domain-containing protein, partial [Chloroflexota bacterium]|nr:methyltransferase domain-containing protein [Chloroflexota bacterium]